MLETTGCFAWIRIQKSVLHTIRHTSILGNSIPTGYIKQKRKRMLLEFQFKGII